MTRTAAREIAIKLVFRLSINPDNTEEALDEFFCEDYYETLAQEDEVYSKRPDEIQEKYIRSLVTGTVLHKEEIDGYIERYSKNWKVERISKMAAAIMRCAIYEILYMDDVPNAAAINEAVELSKDYEEPETTAFINGILGSFMRGEMEGEDDGD